LFRIAAELDVFDARRGADRMARGAGFTRADAGFVTLIVSELGYNIVRHGRGGLISLDVTAHAQHGPALRIVAQDNGPEIKDFALASRDGHDAAGPIDPALLINRAGIGSGLGAIVRLSHEFHYEHRESGNVFTVTRYARPPRKRAKGA
jgi:anti-sigma regulatory factor (Ser/Thr protein kinase)